MKKMLITSTALFIVGFCATIIWQQGVGQDLAIYNNLSEAQKSQFWELHQQWIDGANEIQITMMAKQKELLILKEKPKPDESRLQSLSDDILEMKKALADKRIQFVVKAKKISPEFDHISFDFMGKSIGPGVMGTDNGIEMRRKSDPNPDINGNQ